MHYMFDEEKRVRAFLRNVTDRLEEGGVYIGTTIDADRLVSKIRMEGKDNLSIGNSLYRI